MPRERRARAAGRRPGVGRPSRERLPKLSPAARPICPCEHMGVFLRITVNYCARYRNYEHILTCIRKHVTCVLGELDTARDFTAIVKLVCGSALGLAGRSGWLAGLAESPPPQEDSPVDFPTPAAAFRSAGVCGHVFCSPNPDLKQALFQDLLLVSCSLVIALVSHFRFRFVTLAKCRVTQVSGSCFSFVPNFVKS